MPKRTSIEWLTFEESQPPTNERLLLLVSVAGDPPDIRFIGCEIVTGYWDGNRCHPITLEPHADVLATCSSCAGG